MSQSAGYREGENLILTERWIERANGGPGGRPQARLNRVIGELGGGCRQVMVRCRREDIDSLGMYASLGFVPETELGPDVMLALPLTGAAQTMDIRGVIFDMDGLLFDTESLYLKAWPAVGKMMGLPVTLEVCRKAVGLCNEDHERLFQVHYGPAFTMEKALPLMEAWMREYLDQNRLPVKPGAKELLEKLREKGISTAVGSSNLQYVVEEFLELADFCRYFDTWVTGDMVEEKKPAPDIFLRAAKELGLPPERCLVLEDSPVGAEGAWRAGCITAVVPDQIMPDEETRGRVWRIFSSLEQVPLALF